MATVQVFFLGLLAIVHDVAAHGLSPVFKDQSKRPHLTGCVSREMESFHCSWSIGTFQNLTEPGDLRLFYMFQDIVSPKEWMECPKYALLTENKCYFGIEHTRIWTIYQVQLRSRDQHIVYDEVQFTVENIVYPDPPVALNWTMLNIGMTNMYTDVVLNWGPPPSAVNHVEVGWLVLEYEIQYREVNSPIWIILNTDTETRRYIYGLHTNKDYEIRVRCRMKDFKNFSNFTDTLLINVPARAMPPIALGFFFTALGFVILGLLVLFTRQKKKLMVIFLPPVPGPKIRGINPELLKEGKLAELTAILSNHSILRADAYNDDAWVEFIELDIEKPNEGEQDLETTFLIDRSPSSNSTHLTNDFRDDDSGRASCCEQDLPDSDTAEFRTPVQSSLSSSPSSSSAIDPAVQTGAEPQQVKTQESWPGTLDLYAQVRQVTLSGEVVLTPEEREQATKVDDKPKCDDQTKKKPEFQLLVLDDSEGKMHGDDNANASEPHTNNMTTISQSPGPHTPSISPAPEDVNSSLLGHREPQVVVNLAAAGAAPVSSGLLSTPPPGSPPPLPPAEYTVVDGTDPQNSLLLRSNVTMSSAASSSQVKQMPSPEGYLTPELLDSIAF